MIMMSRDRRDHRHPCQDVGGTAARNEMKYENDRGAEGGLGSAYAPQIGEESNAEDRDSGDERLNTH